MAQQQQQQQLPLYHNFGAGSASLAALRVDPTVNGKPEGGAPSTMASPSSGASSSGGGQPEPMLFGMPLKYVSLATLVIQNSSLVIALRYSRIVTGPMYYSSTAVVVSELIKLFTCIGLIFLSEGQSRTRTVYRLRADLLDQPYETLKLGVPAVLYTIQNNLQYVAASNLDAAVFQVTYQLKILTTALFSVFILRKALNRTRWLSLLILTAGVALVQLPPEAISAWFASAGSAVGAVLTVAPTVAHTNTAVGLSAILTACVISGFAGVYFEKILKGSDVSIWMRNVQLGLFGSVIGLLGALLKVRLSLIQVNGFK